MVATYVAALNRCRYCRNNHTRVLASFGEQYSETANALRSADLESAPITPAERLLLEFTGTLTQHGYRISDEQVQGLRDAGWTDAQIAEVVYAGAFMNMVTRIADAFGIGQDA